MTRLTAAGSPPSLMAWPTIRRTFQRSRLAEEFLAAAYDAVVQMDVKALTDAEQDPISRRAKRIEPRRAEHVG